MEIVDTLKPKAYTSRVIKLGKYLKKNSIKKNSLIELAYDNGPIFCPAFTDSSVDLFNRIKKNPKAT